MILVVEALSKYTLCCTLCILLDHVLVVARVDLLDRGDGNGQSLGIVSVPEAKLGTGQFGINVRIGGTVAVAEDDGVLHHDDGGYDIVHVVVQLVDEVDGFLERAVEQLYIQRRCIDEVPASGS